MGLDNSSEFNDVMGEGYVSGPVSVTTSEIEAKVGGSRLAGREALTITNKGTAKVYYGPTGVTSTTGDVLEKDQFVSLPMGDIGVFVITASGTATVIVQEMA
jgi:hypothetical protein